jgi:type 1 fimbria pilin
MPSRFAIPTALVFVTLAAVAVAAPIAKDRFTVTDGDTIHMKGDKFGTCLVGYNAPETNRSNAKCSAEVALGKRATDRLRSLIYSAKSVALTKVACSCPSGTEGTSRCNFSRSCGVLRTREKRGSEAWPKAEGDRAG